MNDAERIHNYLELLKIRRKAHLRNLFINGGLFLLTILATSAALLSTEWNERSIWMLGIFNILMLMGFVMAWTRLEIIKENIDLVKNISRQDGG